MEGSDGGLGRMLSTSCTTGSLSRRSLLSARGLELSHGRFRGVASKFQRHVKVFKREHIYQLRATGAQVQAVFLRSSV